MAGKPDLGGCVLFDAAGKEKLILAAFDTHGGTRGESNHSWDGSLNGKSLSFDSLREVREYCRKHRLRLTRRPLTEREVDRIMGRG